MRQIILIAHNLRSAHNVGSLLRTADGLGLETVIMTGYTPYPPAAGDPRLPHIARRAGNRIAKTALGAEEFVPWRHVDDLLAEIQRLRQLGYCVAALEQSPGSTLLPGFKPPGKLAIIVGREVEGLEDEVISACDLVLEIPMAGRKESFNVAQAAAMTLYHCALVK